MKKTDPLQALLDVSFEQYCVEIIRVPFYSSLCKQDYETLYEQYEQWQEQMKAKIGSNPQPVHTDHEPGQQVGDYLFVLHKAEGDLIEEMVLQALETGKIGDRALEDVDKKRLLNILMFVEKE